MMKDIQWELIDQEKRKEMWVVQNEQKCKDRTTRAARGVNLYKHTAKSAKMIIPRA
jgi:hypothetical protein